MHELGPQFVETVVEGLSLEDASRLVQWALAVSQCLQLGCLLVLSRASKHRLCVLSCNRRRERAPVLLKQELFFLTQLILQLLLQVLDLKVGLIEDLNLFSAYLELLGFFLLKLLLVFGLDDFQLICTVF